MKKSKIVISILIYGIVYVLMTLYIYFETHDSFSWLIALSIILPISAILIWHENRHEKKKKNSFNKVNEFLIKNNFELLYFEYGNKLYGFERISIHFRYKKEKFEFWTERGKIYCGRKMLYDFSHLKNKIEAIDLIIEKIQEYLFNNEFGNLNEVDEFYEFYK